MKLLAKPFGFETGGKPVVILNKSDAETLGVHALERVLVSAKEKSIIAIVDISSQFCLPGEIGISEEIKTALNVKLGDTLNVKIAPAPESVEFIRQKISGLRLDAHQMYAIVKDIVEKHLSDIEMSAFVTSLCFHGLSLDEAYHLSEAMFLTGKKLEIKGRTIVDKHSIGGIPGDKTSLLVVPIIAAAGLTIPKTSSRAITSPAGTADRMEVLAPVSHTAEEIKKIVKKTNGCLVWGGALDLAPADDSLIKIEFPLGIDPLLLPSIMSKKRSVGANFLVIDIPTGRGAKIKTTGEANNLAQQFIALGHKMNITVQCAATFGEQPLGYAVGPALEAQEALNTLIGNYSSEVLEKATHIAGMLLELTGKVRNGKEIAMNIIKSKKAERKMREIIAEQGGNEKIKPEDIPVGSKFVDIKSEKDGRVFWIKNSDIVLIAREAGAPKDAGAGIRFFVKMGDPVKKGQTIMRIYSNNSQNLETALKLAENLEPIIIGKKYEEKMLIEKIPSKIPHKKFVIIER
ncbi:MAG: AMP phosphorylase [Candidatus Aenigmarchaeota archaeon]|nr:AMP phosphorylase [Candidatus Aenigmarchaeota archaeon]